MVKVKWLYSELPITLSTLAEKMKECTYSEHSGTGFLLSKSTSSVLKGKYIEKVINKERVEDPFGNITEVEGLTYYTCNFSWHTKSKLLLISTPPRSIRKFVNQIHSLTGLGLVISELEVNMLHWLDALEHKVSNISISHISCYGVQTSPNTTARISLSGKAEVKEALLSLVGKKKFHVDKVTLEATYEDINFKAELNKNGACKLKAIHSAKISKILSITLEEANI